MEDLYWYCDEQKNKYSLSSDTIKNMEYHLNHNIKIIYTHPMDSKTYKNYKIDKWMVSKISKILYNIDIENKLDVNYDSICETYHFTEFENCFEFIWNQIMDYFRFKQSDISEYNYIVKSKTMVFDIFFNDYYFIFIQRF
jgi:hypothetical protein